MARLARARPARTSGMTLIEILVVVGIILIITAMLGAGMRTVTDKARFKAAKALIGRIQTALESYNGEFRDFPPDGYDNENIAGSPVVMTVNGQGIVVGYGTKRRAVKGTASLIYFLCRPVTKISTMGGGGSDMSDRRNQVLKVVGPFLTIEPSNLTRPEATLGSETTPTPFDPNFPWLGTRADLFWGVAVTNPTSPGNMIRCEIVDPFGRPLCYDKVKTFSSTSDLKYFQPARFHFFGGSGGPAPAGSAPYGAGPHPDTEFLASMSTSDDEELLQTADWPDYGTTIPATASTTMHSDPRFVKGYAGGRYSAGTTASHAPRNVGGYDLWSAGRSWTNARDDITSWD